MYSSRDETAQSLRCGAVVGLLDECRLLPAVNSRSPSVHPKDKDRGRKGRKSLLSCSVERGRSSFSLGAVVGASEVEQLFVGRAKEEEAG